MRNYVGRSGGPADISGDRILRRLGIGGMGQVYLAAHPRLPREDVLKLLEQRVVKSAAGSVPQEVPPFPGLQYPTGVAVDVAGNVYSSRQGDLPQVLKLTPGTQTPWVLPIPGLGDPGGLAVDPGGSVYVADARFNKVRVLAPV